MLLNKKPKQSSVILLSFWFHTLMHTCGTFRTYCNYRELFISVPSDTWPFTTVRHFHQTLGLRDKWISSSSRLTQLYSRGVSYAYLCIPLQQHQYQYTQKQPLWDAVDATDSKLWRSAVREETRTGQSPCTLIFKLHSCFFILSNYKLPHWEEVRLPCLRRATHGCRHH